MAKEDDYIKELIGTELNNVDYLMSTASNFSQESRVVAFIDDIKGQFTTLVGRAATFFNSSKIGNFKPSAVLPGRISEISRGDGYQSIANKGISIPVGFKGWYIDYTSTLASVLDVVEVLDRTVTTTTQKLAAILNEPDRLKAQSELSGMQAAINQLSETDFAKLRAFTGNHGKSQARLGEVFANSNDMIEVYKRVNVLNARCAKIDFAKIDAKTTRLAVLIQDMQKEIEGAGDGGVSGPVASAMSAMIFGLAVTVSVAAVVAAGVQDLSYCLNKNTTELA